MQLLHSTPVSLGGVTLRLARLDNQEYRACIRSGFGSSTAFISLSPGLVCVFDSPTASGLTHQEVGAGGHFLGAMHTMERFRTCFYRPMLSSSENYERWMRNGAQDAAARAGKIYQQRLEAYEQPALDEGVRQEMEEFVNRRRKELGD